MPRWSLSIRESFGIIPMAPMGPKGAEGALPRGPKGPLAPRAKRARALGWTRAQRAPRAPPGVPRAEGPTQGVSISTVLAKHRSENIRSVFSRSNLTRVGGCRVGNKLASKSSTPHP